MRTGVLHQAETVLRNASSVVVCGHVRPDGDAMGSVLALTLMLRELGVSAIPILADDADPPVTYRWLPGFSLYARAAEVASPKVFVAVDTPNLERLGLGRPLAEAAESVVAIDHHPDAIEYGDVHVFDHTSASAGQLVWALAREMGMHRTPGVALCCYTALATDTGRFAFQNTTAQALRDAAEMVEAGVDPAEAARLIYQARSSASLALEARVMTRLTFANNGAVAYAWATDDDFAETGALREEAEHLPEAIRVADGIEVAMLLRQQGAEVRGNLRAKADFDVGEVARTLGGGGHVAAAGFTLKETTCSQVAERVLALLPDHPTKGT